MWDWMLCLWLGKKCPREWLPRRRDQCLTIGSTTTSLWLDPLCSSPSISSTWFSSTRLSASSGWSVSISSVPVCRILFLFWLLPCRKLPSWVCITSRSWPCIRPCWVLAGCSSTTSLSGEMELWILKGVDCFVIHRLVKLTYGWQMFSSEALFIDRLYSWLVYWLNVWYVDTAED